MTDPAPDHRPDAALDALSGALKTSFGLLRGFMLLLLVGYIASGIFVVKQHEKAVVMVFGKVSGLGESRIKQPGLHWTWPKPIAEVIRVPADRVQAVTTSAFWLDESRVIEGDAPVRDTLDPEFDGYTLTGDANILHSRWTIRFTVDDVERYVFARQDPVAVIEQELRRAVVQVVTHFAVERALRTDLSVLKDEVERQVRVRCESRGLGMRVQGVDLVDVSPPRQTDTAFQSVIKNEQDRASAISESRAYTARILNEAQGDADRIRAEGESARQRWVSETEAHADYFEKVLPEFNRNPSVVTRTLWQDTVRRTLAHVDLKYVIRSADGPGQEIRLHLTPEQKKVKLE